MTCLAIPLGGPLAYLFFGINRVRRRARKLSTASAKRTGRIWVDEDAETAMRLADGERRRFERCGQRITPLPMVGGNRIETLHNGENAYPRMLDDIANAKQRVWLAVYIFDTDETGNKFIDALKDATHRGLDVRVLIDGFGQLPSLPRASSRLKKAGVPCAQFLPPRLFPPLVSFNLRNHRKILVVDDDIGFIGGMNITNRHVTTRNDSRDIVDVHFRVEGNMARQLADVFRDDWRFASDEELPEAEPPDDDIGPNASPIRARVITDGPDRDLDKLAVLLQGITASADKSLKIMTPYFLPGRDLIAALKSAVLRGIDVTVLLPAKSDLPYMTWATRNMLGEMLEWGIKFYYQPPPFVHSKLIIADDTYAMIGSANIDTRSLRLNFEIVAEIFNAGFVGELAEHFAESLAKAQPVELETLENRGFATRLRDAIAWMFSPYL